MVTVTGTAGNPPERGGRRPAPAPRVRHPGAPAPRHGPRQDRLEILAACGADIAELEKELEDYLDRTLEARTGSGEPEQTAAFQRVLQRAAWHVQGAGRTELNAGDVLVAIRSAAPTPSSSSTSRASAASTSCPTSPTG